MRVRSRVIYELKMRGVRWKCRLYMKLGKWGYCYDPKHFFHPIFSQVKLSTERLVELTDRQAAKMKRLTDES